MAVEGERISRVLREACTPRNVVRTCPAAGWGLKVIVTSWTNFKFNELDFSGTPAEPDFDKASHGAGNVNFSNPTILGPLKIEVKPYLVPLKGGSGGYWLKTCLPPSAWKALGQQ